MTIADVLWKLGFLAANLKLRRLAGKLLKLSLTLEAHREEPERERPQGFHCHGSANFSNCHYAIAAESPSFCRSWEKVNAKREGRWASPVASNWTPSKGGATEYGLRQYRTGVEQYSTNDHKRS